MTTVSYNAPNWWLEVASATGLGWVLATDRPAPALCDIAPETMSAEERPHWKMAWPSSVDHDFINMSYGLVSEGWSGGY